MKRQSIRPYYAIAGCFLLAIIALKIIEFFISEFDIPNSAQLLTNALVYNCVIVSWAILGIGILYFLISFLSPKVANIVASSIFGLYLVSETGLIIYTLHNGYALGSELFARPISESLTAIRGAMGVFLPIVLTIILLGGFIVLALWRVRRVGLKIKNEGVRVDGDESNKKKRKFHRTYIVPIIVVLFVLMSLVFKMSHLLTFDIHNSFVFNKTYFLIDDSISYYKYWNEATNGANSTAKQFAELKLSDEELNELHYTHPEWGSPLDRDYPLERNYIADTFLNNFFKARSYKSEPPNIVIILVESMGHEFMGWGAMPFVDSLAATGLYWPNCLSATKRSYGAIPAITGSLGGPKGFQFGTMPNHNSLISLLRNEGYNTRAYYGGDFTFDCIYEYLSAQNIDYMSPFFDEYNKLPESKDGFWWGAGDDYLFKNTITNMDSVATSPFFALITTLTMHDGLKIADKKLEASYKEKAKRVCKSKRQTQIGVSASLFTDDCIREFIHKYSVRADFDNTIFVLVGDHSSGRMNDDQLSYHHVPLIIWSPLVKHPARFSHIVTHNNIAPALYSLLTSHFGMQAQNTVHWLSDGLGPTPKTLLIVDYMHEIKDIIYHNYYYESAGKHKSEKVLWFDTTMVLKEFNSNNGRTSVSEEQAKSECRKQLELMKKLFFYTYFCNRLTTHPLTNRSYTVFRKYYSNTDVVCQYPDEPSSNGEITQHILPITNIPPVKDYTTVRVNIEADVTIDRDLKISQNPDIRFIFIGDTKITENDKLSKFLAINDAHKAGTYHLSLSKEFPSSSSTASTIEAKICIPRNYPEFVPGTTITISNALWTFSYGK